MKMPVQMMTEVSARDVHWMNEWMNERMRKWKWEFKNKKKTSRKLYYKNLHIHNSYIRIVQCIQNTQARKRNRTNAIWSSLPLSLAAFWVHAPLMRIYKIIRCDSLFFLHYFGVYYFFFLFFVFSVSFAIVAAATTSDAAVAGEACCSRYLCSFSLLPLYFPSSW